MRVCVCCARWNIGGEKKWFESQQPEKTNYLLLPRTVRECFLSSSENGNIKNPFETGSMMEIVQTLNPSFFRGDILSNIKKIPLTFHQPELPVFFRSFFFHRLVCQLIDRLSWKQWPPPPRNKKIYFMTSSIITLESFNSNKRKVFFFSLSKSNF